MNKSNPLTNFANVQGGRKRFRCEEPGCEMAFAHRHTLVKHVKREHSPSKKGKARPVTSSSRAAAVADSDGGDASAKAARAPKRKRAGSTNVTPFASEETNAAKGAHDSRKKRAAEAGSTESAVGSPSRGRRSSVSPRQSASASELSLPPRTIAAPSSARERAAAAADSAAVIAAGTMTEGGCSQPGGERQEPNGCSNEVPVGEEGTREGRESVGPGAAVAGGDKARQAGQTSCSGAEVV